MRSEMKAVLVAVSVVLSGCGGAAEEVPGGDTGEQVQDVPETPAPRFTKAAWTEQPTCVGGVLGGKWGTFFGVSPPALLGTIPVACCPAPGSYAAICNCTHGSETACTVTVADGCKATLVGHSEYNETVTLVP